MKRIRDYGKRILAFLLAVSLMLTGIYLLEKKTSTATYAQKPFSGMSALVSENSSDNPYNILEIVANIEDASIGFLVDGEEPMYVDSSYSNWKEELSAKTGASERNAYMTALNNKYSAYIGSDKALSFSTYSECYLESQKTPSADYQEITLKRQELVAKTSFYGYVMTPESGGNYQKHYELIPKSDGSGNTNENVAYYERDTSKNGVYYSLIFEKNSGSGSTYSAEIYKTFRSKTAFTEYYESNNSEGSFAVYSADRGDEDEADKHLKYVSSLKECYDALKADNSSLDFSNKRYYLVNFIYDVKGEYSVKTVSFKPDGLGEYRAGALDPENPYVSGSNFVLNGEPYYIEVLAGKGGYVLKQQANSYPDLGIMVSKVYYTGGIHNRDLFVREVVNAGLSGDNINEINVSVKTVLIKDLKESDIENADLIYINANTKSFNTILLNKILDRCYGSELMPLIVKNGTINDKLKDLPSKDSDGNYVVKNVFVTSDIIKLFATESFANGTSEANFLSSARDAGFSEIAEYINHENSLYMSEFSTDDICFDRNITRAIAVEYIINYGNMRNRSWDATVNVLDIEPCLKANDTCLTKEAVAKWFSTAGYEVKSITVTTVSTAELNGRIEDLSNYDMIYFGDNTSAFNKDSNGKTVYNDPNMDGLIYSNVGDIIVINTSGDPLYHAGLLDTDYQTDWLGRKTVTGSLTQRSNTDTNKYVKDNKGEYIYLDGKYYTCKASDDIYYLYEEGQTESVYQQIISQYRTAFTYKSGDYYYIEYKVGNRWGIGWTSKRYGMTRSRYNSLQKYSRNTSTNDKYLSGYQTYRYSGNDITDEKLLAIEKYVGAGFPVVVADSLTDSGLVNTNTVDNCSNMYRLVSTLLNEKSVFALSMVKNVSEKEAGPKIGELYTYVQTTVPEITILSQNVAGENYMEVDNHKLSIDFILTNPGAGDESITYDVDLLLDINSDGKFSSTGEVVGDNDVLLVGNGKLLSPVKDKTGDGYHFVLSTGVNYTLSYKIADEVFGIIPWKILITQNTGNENRYDSAVGYGHIDAGDDLQEVSIIQVMSSRNNNFDMESELRNNGAFSGYFDRIDKSNQTYVVAEIADFKLKINSISAADYLGIVQSDSKAEVPGLKFLEGYDMLISGFDDMYQLGKDSNDTVKKAVYAFAAYAEKGNSVLFTHDNTSFCNYQSNHWGYYFNCLIRDCSGMDRYGITLNNSNLEYSAKGIGTNVLKKGSIINQNSADYATAQSFADSNSKDLAYEPKSGKSVIVKQQQGFTTIDLNNQSIKSNTYNKYYHTNATTNVTSVAQVNSGQITSYPYDIDSDSLQSVSETHAQYYQLDLNEDEDLDGMSDIVVWYTLATGEYDRAVKDVRNNYYIYTKGNITYSGVGHSAINTEFEFKLYINTMIAAYSVGNKAPGITVSEEATASIALKTLYVSYDESYGQENPIDVFSGTETLYYKIQDNNYNTGKKVFWAEFYIAANKNEKGAVEIIPGSGVYGILLKDAVGKKGRQENLNSGLVYTFNLDLNQFNNAKYDEFTIYVIAGGSIDGVELPTSEIGSCTFNIQKVGLGDLD